MRARSRTELGVRDDGGAPANFDDSGGRSRDGGGAWRELLDPSCGGNDAEAGGAAARCELDGERDEESGGGNADLRLELEGAPDDGTFEELIGTLAELTGPFAELTGACVCDSGLFMDSGTRAACGTSTAGTLCEPDGGELSAVAMASAICGAADACGTAGNEADEGERGFAGTPPGIVEGRAGAVGRLAARTPMGAFFWPGRSSCRVIANA